MIPSKKIEIFCGTGGVGKTTLATSRALKLAQTGKKVLLITIDPAKRLKQILGLENANEGEVIQLSNDVFGPHSDNIFALLMSPKATLKRMASLSGAGESLDNPIINILTRPYGGMNEIMAIIEVQYQISTNNFDSIVLDTPPGKHFIDFLESTQKIYQFFDKSFVDIFKYLGKKFTNENEKEKTGLLSLLVQTGVKKLLKYLEKVTGESFVEEFIDAISGLYRNRKAFTDALAFQEHLKKPEESNWFLVTSVDQQKVSEASGLQLDAQKFMHKDSYLVVNKSLMPYLNAWQPNESSTSLVKLRNSMKERENAIKGMATEGYKEVLFFPEILGTEPKSHVNELAQSWS
ncbi:MAG: AAA family ATPase [Bacteriovoracaceae bacterium]|nr:AAA family ATPase [Bacteriovoracaceae bacterium]